MDNDIVKRLHDEADYWCHDEPIKIFLEAADEIERLRADISELRNLLWDITKNG